MRGCRGNWVVGLNRFLGSWVFVFKKVGGLLGGCVDFRLILVFVI